MNGRPPSRALQAAADWYAQLTSGRASADDYRSWQAWRDAHAEHEHAWQKVENITGTFRHIPPAIGLATLDRPGKLRSEGRRRALKQLGLLLVAGTAGWQAYRREPWAEMLADYATAAGERREIMLADGSRIILNTASAVDVAFDADRRLLRLVKGEVLIQTGREQLARHRPFLVKTRHGTATALGTRFSVRLHDDRSRVSVFEHAVEIMPEGNSGASTILQAGESIEFTTVGHAAKGIADPAEIAWQHGFLVVDQMPLGEFIAELARYRKGFLRCDPAIAALRISGSFPVGNTDAALAGIAAILPVRIETYTSYWVNVRPA